MDWNWNIFSWPSMDNWIIFVYKTRIIVKTSHIGHSTNQGAIYICASYINLNMILLSLPTLNTHLISDISFVYQSIIIIVDSQLRPKSKMLSHSSLNIYDLINAKSQKLTGVSWPYPPPPFVQSFGCFGSFGIL